MHAPKKEHAPKLSHELERPKIELEKSLERSEENRPEESSRFEEERPTFKKSSAIKRAQTQIPSPRDPLTLKVEKILEENVGEAYSRLSPLAKQEFKIKGEVVAEKIATLLRSTHIKAKKIFQLIFDWLKLLPGVNKFFLEQEAKIKTDKIIALHNRK